MNESWNRHNEARVRIREGGLKELLKALQDPEGFTFTSKPVVRLIEGGIYVEVPMNVGKQGNVNFLGLDIMIPIEGLVVEPEIGVQKEEEVVNE